MASYQDLETRVIVLESMLKFVMEHFRMSGVVTSGLTDGAGRPIGKHIEGNLLDLYRLAKTQSLPIVSATDLMPPSSAPAVEASQMQEAQTLGGPIRTD